MRTFFVLCFLAFLFTCEAASVHINDVAIELQKGQLREVATEYRIFIEKGKLSFGRFEGLEGGQCHALLFRYTEETLNSTNLLKEENYYYAFSCSADNCATDTTETYFISGAIPKVFRLSDLDYEKFLLLIECGDSKYSAQIQIEIPTYTKYHDDEDLWTLDSLRSISAEGMSYFAIQPIADLVKPGKHFLGKLFKEKNSTGMCLQRKVNKIK